VEKRGKRLLNKIIIDIVTPLPIGKDYFLTLRKIAKKYLKSFVFAF